MSSIFRSQSCPHHRVRDEIGPAVTLTRVVSSVQKLLTLVRAIASAKGKILLSLKTSVALTKTIAAGIGSLLQGPLIYSRNHRPYRPQNPPRKMRSMKKPSKKLCLSSMSSQNSIRQVNFFNINFLVCFLLLDLFISVNPNVISYWSTKKITATFYGLGRV